MTVADFAKIEGSLGVSLPGSYRELMQTRCDELKGLTYRASGGMRDWFVERETIYLNPAALIAANREERKRGSGTQDAFPGWSKTFFMVGTNGGGGYYCLRLDGDPRVWLIGSDCGDTPNLIANSLAEFIDQEVSRYREVASRPPQVPPSSFDESCPPIERFKISIHSRGGCSIRCQERDWPVTEATFRHHGIDTNALARHVLGILAAVAKSPTEAVQTTFEPEPSTDMAAELPLHHVPLGDSRFWIVQVNFSQGQILIKIRLNGPATPNPIPGEVGIDWTHLKTATTNLFQALFPKGIGVHVSDPSPARAPEPEEWSYELAYSLFPVSA